MHSIARYFLAAGLASLSLLLSALAPAQEESVRPGINKSYENPDIDRSIERFEGESREVFRRRDDIAAACGIKPGMTVADIGAGTGLFTRIFAPMVGPGGKVLAVDIAPKYVEHIETTCKERGIDNVEGVVCKPDSVELAPHSADLAFVCDTYHHFEFPQKTLASIHRALRPGGRLVIVDFKREPGKSPEWVLNHVRAGQEEVVREAAAEGFHLADEPLKMETQYMVCFQKDYFKLRGRLANSRIRFARDKQGRVAFLGGSITNMDPGWRSMTCEVLARRFPDTQFDFINAGISSTDSTLGPYRLGETVLHRGPVDLLFVEFAVNDHHNTRAHEERIRGMEGIVRQARRRNPLIDIVFLYSAEPDKTADYLAGNVPEEIASHERVARHYRIPAIDLALEVTQRVARGEFSWEKDFRGLHPAPFGHKVYAATIGRMLDAAWKEPLAADAKPQAATMPDQPLDPKNYEHGRLVDLSGAELREGFRLVPSWEASGGRVRQGFHKVPMLEATEPCAELRFAFEGTAVGLLIVAGPDVGVLEYCVDGGQPRKVDQFTQWSEGLHLPWALMLCADLPPGRHQLVLRTTDEKNEKSKGHAVRIVRFLVNGTVPGE